MSPLPLPPRLKPLVDWLTGLFHNRLFLLCVVVPTSLAILYFGLIASDVYVSESTLIVHTQEERPQSPLGLMLRGAGLPATDATTEAVRRTYSRATRCRHSTRTCTWGVPLPATT